jgi:hypothetical protein
MKKAGFGLIGCGTWGAVHARTAVPSIHPTYAGLLSFLLAPVGLIAGSMLFPTAEKRGSSASDDVSLS